MKVLIPINTCDIITNQNNRYIDVITALCWHWTCCYYHVLTISVFMQNGNVLCVSKECPKLNCEIRVTDPGQCCERCQGMLNKRWFSVCFIGCRDILVHLRKLTSHFLIYQHVLSLSDCSGGLMLSSLWFIMGCCNLLSKTKFCWFSAVPRGFSRPSGFPPLGKITFDLGCAPWSYGLMWLAAKRALACLLLEHIVAASFAIQLLAASNDDYPPPPNC